MKRRHDGRWFTFDYDRHFGLQIGIGRDLDIVLGGRRRHMRALPYHRDIRFGPVRIVRPKP